MKLTKAQERAKAKLTDKWQSAYTLKESLSTLRGLAHRKEAEMINGNLGAIFSPRTSIFFKRISVVKESDHV